MPNDQLPMFNLPTPAAKRTLGAAYIAKCRQNPQWRAKMEAIADWIDREIVLHQDYDSVALTESFTIAIGEPPPWQIYNQPMPGFCFVREIGTHYLRLSLAGDTDDCCARVRAALRGNVDGIRPQK